MLPIPRVSNFIQYLILKRRKCNPKKIFYFFFQNPGYLFLNPVLMVK